VQLQDFDYIDISEEHVEAGVVTVVIKSLVFTG
jgi:ethanolamine utilization protein EutA (predicted chaperonin)